MHRTRSLLRFLGALAGVNLRATIALRTAFLMQASFMLLNNLAFFTMWLIFFHRFDTLGGWQLGDVGVVFGTVAFAFGLAHIVGGGAPQLARMIVAGDLDAMLTQPKHPLLQAVASRSSPAAWGDMATGFVFLALAGRLDPAGIALLLLVGTAAALGFLAAIVIFMCGAFWLGRVEPLALMLADFTLTFSLYPRPLFGGAMRILLFTVVPAGLVGWLPSEAIRDPGLAPVAGTLVSAAGLVALAFLVFELGLRHYESGNRFGTAG